MCGSTSDIAYPRCLHVTADETGMLLKCGRMVTANMINAMGRRVSCTLRALPVSEDEQLVQVMGIVAYGFKK